MGTTERGSMKSKNHP